MISQSFLQKGDKCNWQLISAVHAKIKTSIQITVTVIMLNHLFIHEKPLNTNKNKVKLYYTFNWKWTSSYGACSLHFPA